MDTRIEFSEGTMKVEREIALHAALDELETIARWLRDGNVKVNGRQLQPDDTVTYELEIETKGDSLEIEFEITWRKQEAQPEQPAGPGFGEAAVSPPPY